jgi:hypothetical protein
MAIWASGFADVDEGYDAAGTCELMVRKTPFVVA